jgi:hypothetical protein
MNWARRKELDEIRRPYEPLPLATTETPWARGIEQATRQLRRVAAGQDPGKGIDFSFRRQALKTMERDKKQDAPSCPACDMTMMLRHRRSDNEPFWGCRYYPDCKKTRPYKVP